MEHRKLIPFMILCNKCSRGWSVSREDFEKITVTCPECRNEFSVYEGIKNGLKKN